MPNSTNAKFQTCPILKILNLLTEISNLPNSVFQWSLRRRHRPIEIAMSIRSGNWWRRKRPWSRRASSPPTPLGCWRRMPRTKDSAGRDKSEGRNRGSPFRPSPTRSWLAPIRRDWKCLTDHLRAHFLNKNDLRQLNHPYRILTFQSWQFGSREHP